MIGVLNKAGRRALLPLAGPNHNASFWEDHVMAVQQSTDRAENAQHLGAGEISLDSRRHKYCAHCGALISRKRHQNNTAWFAQRGCGMTCKAALARRPLAERFWEKVDKSSGDDGCWLWTGAVNRCGYGRVGRGNKYGGAAMAHRVAYQLVEGPIGDGLFVCHSCDNPPCVNPAHLFLGTNQDNMDDMVRKGRSPRKDNSGENNPSAKLTNCEVATIKRRLLNGEKVNVVAADYGVVPRLVSDIKVGRNWRGIEPARLETLEDTTHDDAG